MTTLTERIRVARGEGEADLLFRNGRVINVFSGQVEKKSVAVFDGRVIGFGDYPAREVVDLKGALLCPGLIDGHVHVESSMVTVPEFGRAVLPHGTTTAIIDPHEIANVLGTEGIRFMARSAESTPLEVFIMIPSCVPATHLETSGADLRASHLKPLLKEPWALGLAEVMNFPGVMNGDPGVLAKIDAARGKRIDGHAPFLTGKALHAYLVAGVRSDHECTTAREATEKMAAGMWIMVREGTTARNLEALLPAVTETNSRRFFFVTDDRHPEELLGEGHVNGMLRKAVGLGLNPITAIRMATLNTAEYFGLHHLGAIAPGYQADFVVFDHLSRFQPKRVYKKGRLVAEDGRVFGPESNGTLPSPLPKGNRIRLQPVTKEKIQRRSNQALAKVIQVIPDQIVTKKVMREVPLRDGIAFASPEQDLLKIVVVERHRATGNVGVGFVEGFGFKRGAIASTVAHDSHNLVAVGASDADILMAIRVVGELGGGMAVVAGGKTLATIPLPIAGLMSEAAVPEVGRQMKDLLKAARSLGGSLRDPFMTLSFMALPVIPELRITDKGLVDVGRFEIVPVFGDD
jgi:adenine deaminase